MVVGAGLLVVSFLIGAWSNQPRLAILGLLCNGLAFGLLESAPWLLLASSSTTGTPGRWYGWGSNLNVVPIWIGSVIAIPLGHMTPNRLGLLASFFILLAILFLHGTRDPLWSLHKPEIQPESPALEADDVLTDERFEHFFVMC